MAASVTSPWGKPGAWALDSEEHEDELKQQQQPQPQPPTPAVPSSDFPDLMTAATTKTKKKKGQTLSLGEFVTGKANNSNTYKPNTGLTTEDMLMLPTGPRQRTAEEMDRTRLGNGFRSYGGGGDRSNSESSRWGQGRSNGNGDDDGRRPSREPLGPSRADETDDWGAAKKSTGFERRERSGGFFEGSNSRADDSDSWASNKTGFKVEGRRGGSGFDRERRVGMGFESNGEADSSDNWGRKKDVEVRKFGGGGTGSAFDSLRDRRGGGGGGGDSDADVWGRKREEVVGGGGSRPKLNLQPRKVAVVGEVETVKVTKGANPFGDARPREEVLKEKGEDWKEIDEKLEAMKVKDLGSGDRFKRGGGGNPRSNEDSSERSWRKNASESAVDVSPPS
ncbi:eukaryotic translation initiation factor 4B3-like isoform X2 [Rutidosis leptorrhynchoides]